MLIYKCLKCGKENRLEDLKKIPTFGDDIFGYCKFSCSCGQNEFTIESNKFI